MLATTRGALLRGTSTDALGDEVNANADPVVGWEDFPLSMIEKSTREQEPSTGIWRTVRYFAGRIPSNVPIAEGDRIRDNRTGAIFAVSQIRREPRSLAGRASTTLRLRRTAAP